MRDLELWRRIARGEATADDLAPLAQWPIARRAAHLGRIAALATHAEPPVRSATLSVLAGARGVPGVRLIVDALADPEPAVWAAAVAALRVTAKDAPYRYVHALFHPRVEIRRAALTEVPHGATEPAAYLRADPACADLAAALPWPDKPLPLAFELHRTGALASDELVRLIGAGTPGELRAYLDSERGRDAETVDAYLAACHAAGALQPPAGEDPCDSLARALDEAMNERAVTNALAAATTRGPRPLARRFAAALLGRIATAPGRVSIMLAAALEPLVIPMLPPVHADAIATGLVRFGWPVRPPIKDVQALLAVPWVAADLAAAAAIAGLFTGKRLKRLKRALGEAAIIASLVVGDRGWDEILRLPEEKPWLELMWLALLEEYPERHAVLAGRALVVLTGARLEAFVTRLRRSDRAPAFLALCARADISPEDPKLATAAAVMAPHIERTQSAEILTRLLATDRGLAIALVYARALTDKQLASAAKLVDDAALARFVIVLDGFDALPRDREVALGQAIIDRAHPDVRGWAERVTRIVVAAPIVPLPAVRARRDLDETQRHAIATASDKDLETALKPALIAPCTGLCDALSRRRGNPSVAACAALLGSADPLADVAHQLDRFGTMLPRFLDELDNAAMAVWRTGTELPPLVHARLWRWEAHLGAFGRWTERAGGMHAALRAAFEIGGVLAADTLGKGAGELLVFWRYRDRPRFTLEGTPELATYCTQWIDHPVHGKHAARIVVALVEGGAVRLSLVKAALLERVADADAPTRELLARLVRMEGMPEPPRVVAEGPVVDLVAQIKASRDLDELAAWCTDARGSIVQEAVLGLLMLGEPGQLRLAQLLAHVAELAAPVPLLASVALWESEAAISIARTLAARADLPPEWQFHLCVGLGDGPGAIAAVRRPSDAAWFTKREWDALTRIVPTFECAIVLVEATHYHAYAGSVAALLQGQWPGEAARMRDAYVRFLEVDANRPIDMRRTVARRLASDHGDLIGLPILTEELLEEGAPSSTDWITVEAGTEIAHAAVDAALVGGHGACTEKRMWTVVDQLRRHALVEAAALPPLFVRILEGGSTALARRTAAQLAIGESLTHARLESIAEAFAWGVRRGIELTGRLMRIHLTSAEKDLGHTFLTESRIFVSPLPMLRDEPHGRDVVEGLILHELGHHAYHRGEEAQALWKRAHAEGIGHLLNLVADEHLERNLRAVDRAYGDRLKRLDAYAFQHAAQELEVKLLLEALRVHSARALTEIELGVAFDEAAVRIRRGAVLAELEKTGHPLARFARALRMGLGNRFEDPRVATALAMCKDVRKLDMKQMYELTKQLAALFGGSIAIARVFGGPEGLGLGETEREQDVHGAGIDDDILQREVERILDPRKTKSGGKRGPRDRLQINVNPDEQYEKITTIERVRGDAAEHRRLATEVNRHAVRLRHHLDDLGLRWEPAKARIKGHALDRSRLRSLVTRGDPKILIARSPVRKTDLFLGTIIDCSGSMQAGQNIERAKKFGVLIAEAVRLLPGVEARFFGFTDSVIYDAGDARECDVTALEADGGNNDAAALHHVASLAAASHKRARVLVMISDGLPTECSVAALRGLVTTLTKRKGMVCAQVAVRRLEEEIFPNYIVLDDAEIDVAVARFGRMIGDLTRKALM